MNRLGILDISHRKKPLRRKIELLVTGEASILLNLSRPDLPHHVDPRVANPRRCTSDRRGLDSDFDSDRGEERYGIGYSAQPCDIHHSRIHRSPRLWICCLSVERHLEIVNRNTRRGLLFGRRSLCHRGFVFVENVHCRVFLHVVIAVQMFLQLVVRVEGPFNVLHSTDKA